MKQERQPLLLVRNVIYPTYQLWAYAGSRENQDKVLKMAVLHTMEWLRQRFRARELPKELDFPPAADFAKLAFEEFANVSLASGYQLEIVWLPEQKIWTLRLTEPDLGPLPGQLEQPRLPVPGRIFETNISYQASAEGVLCAFKTMVSEPEGISEPSEVFRLGVVKKLTRNPLVGLAQIWKLIETPYEIKTISDINSFRKKIRTEKRTMPVVILSEYLPENETNASFAPAISSGLFAAATPSILPDKFNLADKPPLKPMPALQPWVKDIASQYMGYAHFFVVSAKMRSEFIRQSGLHIPNGGILFYPPAQVDDACAVYDHEQVSGKNFLQELSKTVENYSRGKLFDLPPYCFVPEAQDIHNKKQLEHLHTEAELKKYHAETLERIEQQKRKELAEIANEYSQKLRKLEQNLESTQTKLTAITSVKTSLEDNLQAKIGEAEILLSRLNDLRARPAKLSEVCDWAERNFDTRLIIHERAKRAMKDTQSNVNLMMFCDALESLANEYWEVLNGIINEEKYNLRCSKFYNRAFEICPNSDRTIQMYPSEYTISYFKNGKNIKAQLDKHLKTGTNSEQHLRIYFFYDKSAQKIVIGSMPDHLPVVSIK